MNIFNRLAGQFKKIQPLPEGLYHKQMEGQPLRLHLRLQADGSGLLILNASTVLQLNATAAEYAWHYIKGTVPEDAAKAIAARYRISHAAALNDYNDLADRIQTLIETPDLDPVSFLDFERVAPHSTDLTAPLRLDCALTYRVAAGSKPEVAPTKRVTRELSTDEWKSVLDQAWQVGIPHITFTGGEPTLREDLPDLIAHAEKNGQVCGLLTDGASLSKKKYLDQLLQTGLDHVLLVLHPEDDAAWKAVKLLVPADIFLTVHLTVNRTTVKDATKVIEKLSKAGVRHLSLSASDKKYLGDMLALQAQANELGFTLHWDLPVPYSESNPAAAETEEDNVPSGAGKSWLYVEPDGDVLPAQGAAGRALGNILADSWGKIYPPSLAG
ncbi:MAG: Coenzyme PQQ synthesis protein E [Anaerolineales bacterium]|nr:Coenzyme PQQ synthesis protein E [Anaerolineales bacterium]